MDLNTGNNIELEIEELILHGFAAIDRESIGMAVRQELTRLLTEGGISPGLAQGGDLPRLNGVTIEVPTGARADVVGTQIAQSIYGGLNG